MANLSHTHYLTTSTNSVEDMTTLFNLTEESLLENLDIRYRDKLIYTYTGSILVSVNPYEILPCYLPAVVREYFNKQRGTLPPHIFAIADAAYTSMFEEHKNQSVIISGESGAGKTEATKLIIQYLASRTNKHSEIEQMIVESSPILEAFGNAKTVRNNNSSRFGKYIEIHFNKMGFICGAKIIQYLLEKSRITFQAPSERNYHVFYQLCAGASPEFKAELHLGAPESFHYLNQSGCTTIEKVSDADDFNEMRSAMTFLGLAEDLQKTIFCMLAAVLHLGNVTFEQSDATKGAEGSVVKSIDTLNIAASLLQLDAEALAKALTFRHVFIRGQNFVIPLKTDEATDARDALAKALYDKVFQWLVTFINSRITKANEVANFIGVLDIFGFENFKINSFEQFCINYCNEKLQQHFNQHIFKLEQEEYNREKINWSKINFNDNQECLDLIEKRPLGILSILDEECKFPKATDLTLLEKLHTNHEKHAYYEKPRLTKTNFLIKHYAGDVSYETKGFLDKNKDTLQDDLLTLVQGSKIQFLRDLFDFPKQEDDNDKKGGTKKALALTVGAQFKGQLAALMSTLSATCPHFVRCVKPNTLKQPNNFDREMVLAQLRYAGMMETIRIRRLGYPVRYTHKEFLDRFGVLNDRKFVLANLADTDGASKYVAATPRDSSSLAQCEAILQNLNHCTGIVADDWLLGVSKVFLRDTQFRTVEELRIKLMSAQAVRIQSVWRMFRLKKKFKKMKQAAVVFQQFVKGYQARVLYQKRKASCVIIQAFARMIKARKEYRRIRDMFKVMAVIARGYLARKLYHKDLEEVKERKRRLEEIKRKEADEAERTKLEAEEKERQQQEIAARIESDKKKQAEEIKRQAEEEKKKQAVEEKKKVEEKKQELQELNQLEDINSLSDMLKAQEATHLSELNDIVGNMESFSFESSSATYNYDPKMYNMTTEALENISLSELLMGLRKTISAAISGSEVDEDKFKIPAEYELQTKKTAAAPSGRKAAALLTVKTSTPAEPTPAAAPAPKPAAPAPVSAPPALAVPPPTAVAPPPTGVPPPILPPPVLGAPPPPPGDFPPPPTGDFPPPPPGDFPPPPPGDFPPPPSGDFPPPPSGDFPPPPGDFPPPPPGDFPPPPAGDGSFPPPPLGLPLPSMGVPPPLGMPPPPPTEDLPPPPTTASATDRMLLVEDEEISLYSFKDYAAKYFREQKKKKKGDEVEYVYSKNVLKASLLNLEVEQNKIAIEIANKMYLYVAGKGKAASDWIAQAQFILQKGLVTEELRDEIYAQLIKQTTENPSKDMMVKYFELIAFCSATFMPSTKLIKYLGSHLQHHVQTDKGSVGQLAQLAVKNLVRMKKNGPRKLVPSTQELDALKDNKPIVIKIHLTDGSVKSFIIDSSSTVFEVSESLSSKFVLRPTSAENGFSVIEVFNSIERDLNKEDKVADCLSKFENLEVAMREQKLSINAKLLFKKRMYLEDAITNQMERELVFHQIANDILTGALPCTPDDIVAFGALKLQVDCGDYTADNAKTEAGVITKYLPPRLVKTHTEDLFKQWEELKGVSKDEAKAAHFNTATQLPLYSYTVFEVSHENPTIGLPSNLFLAVNSSGVHFVEKTSQSFLKSISFSQLGSHKVAGKVLSLIWDSPAKSIDLSTSDGARISGLIRDYTAVLKATAKYARALKDYVSADENMLSFRKGDIIIITSRDDTFQWFAGEIEGRSGTFPVEYVELVPGDAMPSAGPSRPPTGTLSRGAAGGRSASMTLRGGALPATPDADGPPSSPPPSRALPSTPPTEGGAAPSLPPRPGEAPRTAEGLLAFARDKFRKPSVAKGKRPPDANQLLTFSKDPIKESLIEMDSKLSKRAAANFLCVMGYMEDYPAPSKMNSTQLAQAVVQLGIDTPELRDEIYCQIWKQTSGNPRQDNTKKGNELLLFCATIFPPSAALAAPLQEAIESRAANNAIAKFTLEKLKATVARLSMSHRRFAPSIKELESLQNLENEFMCKIVLANRTTRAILIGSHTDVRDAYADAGVKINLTHNLKHFGLFELDEEHDTVKTVSESAYLADIISGWETSKSNNKFTVRRKYFFEDPEKILEQESVWTQDPVGFDLTFCQVRDDVLAGKYPVNEKDAAYLAALLVQTRHPNSSKAPITKDSLALFIPKPLHNAKNIKNWISAIELHLFEVVGQTADYTRLLFLKAAAKHSIFGSTLFPAYFKEASQKVLLGISKRGVGVYDVNAKEPRAMWTFGSISSWTLVGDCWVLMSGNLMKPVKSTFQAEDLASIQAVYSAYADHTPSR